MTPDQIEEIIRQCSDKLLAHRLQYRPRPHLDNKVLPSWTYFNHRSSHRGMVLR